MNKGYNVRTYAMRLCLITTMLATTTLASFANEMKFDCPADEVQPQLTLTYKTETLTINENSSTTTIPATFMGAPNEFAIQASAELESLMPDLAALDKCIAAGLKNQKTTAKDLDVLTYLTVNCRSETMKTSTQQKVQASITITAGIGEPNTALVAIDRNYLTPSTVTGMFLTLPQWPPTRTCSFVTQ